jgi:hypothetical protein
MQWATVTHSERSRDPPTCFRRRHVVSTTNGVSEDHQICPGVQKRFHLDPKIKENVENGNNNQADENITNGKAPWSNRGKPLGIFQRIAGSSPRHQVEDGRLQSNETWKAKSIDIVLQANILRPIRPILSTIS